MPTLHKQLDVILPSNVCLGCGQRKPARNSSYCLQCAQFPTAGAAADVELPLLARQEMARRELARRRLLPFIKRLRPDYMAGWFHVDLAARLERFARRCENKESPCMAISVPPRHGKEIADHVPVLTTKGWTTHGELSPGDMVFRPSGKPVEVLQVHPPGIDTMEVELTNGEVIQCHENHEWDVCTRTGGFHTVETRWLAEQPLRRSSGSRDIAAFYLPRVSALQFPDRPLQMHPYALGAWLGDGTTKAASVTHHAGDTEVVEAITACGYAVSTSRVYKSNPNAARTSYGGPRRGVTGLMHRNLKAIGVLDRKHIPDEYKFSSVQQRLELLAGLIDTDGYVTRTGRIVFSNSNRELLDDVAEVVRSMGWRACISPERRGNRQLSFSPDRHIPLRIPRKCAAQKPRPLNTTQRVAIADVRRAENPAIGRCITVSSEDGLYLVGRKLIPTHNSEQASKAFVAWYLGRNPSEEIIAATHSDKLALDNSRDVLQYVKDPAYQTLFPGMVLNKDAKGATGWRTTDGGSYKPVGVGGGIAGYGANVLIIDDPHRDRDAYSETVRANIYRWYKSSARTRLMPGGGQLLIATRWTFDDLIGSVLEEEGRVQDGGLWEEVRYPCQAIEDEYRLPSGIVVPTAVPNATLLRKKGEYLHPERYPAEEMEKHKADPVVWAALYQQEPTAGDAALFKTADLKRVKAKDIPRKGLQYYVTVDLALSQSARSDYTVFMVAGLDADDNLWVIDVVRGRWDSLDIVEKLLDLHAEYQPDMIGVEKSHAQIAIEPLLNKRIAERRMYTANIVPLEHGNKDKLLRAAPIQGRIRQGKVFFPEDAPWFADFSRELDQFPAGKHDDMVDALAYLGQIMEDLTKKRVAKDANARRKASWRDKLKQKRRGERDWRAS